VLAEKEAVATVAVKDVKVAQKFYEGTLGLKPIPVPEPGVLSFRSGGSAILVYESQFARTNQATAATWIVGAELDQIVRDLKGKGVRFEKYDLPDTRHEGDVHVSGRTRVAWFKDPDGNILSLVNG
jgi:catechol 2,3-dioxygenase-like lactoylglutathione lyase family enzyme